MTAFMAQLPARRTPFNTLTEALGGLMAQCRLAYLDQGFLASQGAHGQRSCPSRNRRPPVSGAVRATKSSLRRI
jgi:hypothetical protein